MAQAHKVNVLQAELKLSRLSTADRVTMASVLAKMAPQSAVYASSPAVKDAADKAIKSGDKLTAAATGVRQMELALAAAKAVVTAAEAQLDKDMLCLKSVVEANCKTEGELNDLGFHRRPPRAARAPLTAPASIVVKAGKEKGSIIAHARSAGRAATYFAEISADPVGPSSWQALPGIGVRRTLKGYVSGAHYWIRFRAVRANEQSAWSDPVLAVAG